jgi:predicted naringenin-chalcone synthase
MSNVYIHSIGTAVPEHSLLQTEMCDLVLSATPNDESIRRLISAVYKNSGIEKRYAAVADFKNVPGSPPFIPHEARAEEGPATSFRNRMYEEESVKVSMRAVEKMLSKIPSFDRCSITHIVIASCTGFVAPGLDLYLQRSLSLSPNVERYMIGFMGCFAAFPALRVAHALAQSDRDAKILVVCVELCSLHYRHVFDSETIVANSLFADGAAAVLVSSEPDDGNGSGYLMRSFVSRLIEDSVNDMSWRIGDHGFEMTLSASVPSAIEKNISALVDDASRKAGILLKDVAHWAVHPGGRAIIDKARQALGKDHDAFASSYRILNQYGNMSSATVLFVLEDLLASSIRGNVFTAAFGPGLSAESGILEAY